MAGLKKAPKAPPTIKTGIPEGIKVGKEILGEIPPKQKQLQKRVKQTIEKLAKKFDNGRDIRFLTEDILNQEFDYFYDHLEKTPLVESAINKISKILDGVDNFIGKKGNELTPVDEKELRDLFRSVIRQITFSISNVYPKRVAEVLASSDEAKEALREEEYTPEKLKKDIMTVYNKLLEKHAHPDLLKKFTELLRSRISEFVTFAKRNHERLTESIGELLTILSEDIDNLENVLPEPTFEEVRELVGPYVWAMLEARYKSNAKDKLMGVVSAGVYWKSLLLQTAIELGDDVQNYEVSMGYYFAGHDENGEEQWNIVPFVGYRTEEMNYEAFEDENIPRSHDILLGATGKLETNGLVYVNGEVVGSIDVQDPSYSAGAVEAGIGFHVLKGTGVKIDIEAGGAFSGSKVQQVAEAKAGVHFRDLGLNGLDFSVTGRVGKAFGDLAATGVRASGRAELGKTWNVGDHKLGIHAYGEGGTAEFAGAGVYVGAGGGFRWAWGATAEKGPSTEHQKKIRENEKIREDAGGYAERIKAGYGDYSYYHDALKKEFKKDAYKKLDLSVDDISGDDLSFDLTTDTLDIEQTASHTAKRVIEMWRKYGMKKLKKKYDFE